jgi:hypothetical protein
MSGLRKPQKNKNNPLAELSQEELMQDHSPVEDDDNGSDFNDGEADQGDQGDQEQGQADAGDIAAPAAAAAAAPSVTVVTAATPSAPTKTDKQPQVRVKPNQDIRTYIGDSWYNLTKGKEAVVPATVKEILKRAGMLEAL